MPTQKILVLAGDCLGPEVMVQARRVLAWLNDTGAASFEIEEGLVGGASYDAHRTPLTNETVDLAMAADAVLFGSSFFRACKFLFLILRKKNLGVPIWLRCTLRTR